jgi:hypothetical protein
MQKVVLTHVPLNYFSTVVKHPPAINDEFDLIDARVQPKLHPPQQRPTRAGQL